MRYLLTALFLLTCITFSFGFGPDPSFNNGRGARYGFGMSGDEARAVAVQPDGKILVFAFAYLNSGVMPKGKLLRYNADGSVDGSFGDRGQVLLPRPYGKFRIFVLPDGKIITYGGYYVTRLAPDGDYDTSFSNDGYMAVTQNDISVQSDGRILIGYEETAGTSTTYIVVRRIDPNGDYDNSFGTNGYARVATSGYQYVKTLAVDAGGKIVLAGYALPASGSTSKDMLVARLNSDGSPDKTWGTGGTTIIDHLTRDEVQTIKFDSAGRAVVLGVTSNAASGAPHMFAARFSTGGALDTSFGAGGIQEFPWAQDGSNTFNFALQPDNKIVACTMTNDDFVLVRLTADGPYDGSFGDGGIARTDLGGNDYLKDAALLPDGSVIAAGGNDHGSNDNVAVVKYFPNGTVDQSFGQNGAVFADTGNAPVTKTISKAQPDGKIVSAAQVGALTTWGINQGQSPNLAMTRANADGSPDLEFGNSGKMVWPCDCKLYSVALQDDGKILVGAAATSSYATYVPAIFRFNSDGSLDPTFSDDGLFYALAHNSQATGAPTDIVVQPNGKIVATLAYNHSLLMTVIRLNANGTLDNQFDRDGMVFLNFDGVYQTSHSLALRPDGKILMAGFAAVSNDQALLTQLNPNGTIDTDFGKGGVIFYAPYKHNYPAGLLLQPDGKFMVYNLTPYNSVNYPRYSSTNTMTVSRFTADGSSDVTYGTGGVVYTVFQLNENFTEYANSAVVLSDGGIVIAGGINQRYITPTGIGTPFLKGFDAAGDPDITLSALDTNTTDNQSIMLDGAGRLLIAGPGSVGETGEQTSTVFVGRYVQPQKNSPPYKGEGRHERSE